MRPQKSLCRSLGAVHATRCADGGKEGVDQRIKPSKARLSKVLRKERRKTQNKGRLHLVLGRHSDPCPMKDSSISALENHRAQ
jgi:hypothetical protein